MLWIEYLIYIFTNQCFLNDFFFFFSFLFFFSKLKIKSDDGNGLLDADEFKKVIRHHAKIGVSILPDSDVARIFHTVDVDHSGYIDVAEFVQWLRGGHLSVTAVKDDDNKNRGK